MMYTNHIHVYVQATMSIIYVLSDVSTILLSTASLVTKKSVGHGLSGRHGQHVQKLVAVGKDSVRELLPGTMVVQ